MPLESASFITQLVSTNPPGSDQVSQGDDHLRLIKTVLKAQFPNFTAAAVTSTNAQLDTAVSKTVTGSLALSLPADGAVGTPELTFASEATSGLYRAGAGNLRVSILGADVFGYFATGVGVPTGKTLDLATASSQLTVGGVAVFPLTASNIAANAITTAAITDANVTYAKIQNVAASRILGNPTGAPAAVSEVSLGAGLSFSGSSATNTYVPRQGSFKALAIKVTSNTQATVAADFVAMTDGSGNYRTVPISATLDMTTSNAVNGRSSDAALAIDTWYFLWAISNGSTDGVLASVSSTAPTMPAGYTFKARVGALQTRHADTSLYGIWQLGRKAQYIAGLAGGKPESATTPGVLASGTIGTTGTTTPTLVATQVTGNGKYAPTTASSVDVYYSSIFNASGQNSVSQIAPSQAYSGTNNGPNGTNKLGGTLFWSTVDTLFARFTMLLESANVSIANSGTGVYVILGWEDNL